jgi:hypothetical protein
MGFDWISTTTGSSVNDSVMDQVQEHLVTLYDTDLDIGEPEWSFDINDGDETLEDHMDEVKDAVDYADVQNYCRTHYTTHKDNDYVTYNVSKDDAEDGSVYSTHDTTKQTTHFTSRQSTHYVSRLHGHNDAHNGAHYGARKVSNYSGNYGNNCPTDRAGQRSSNEYPDRTNVKGRNYYSHEAGFNGQLHYGRYHSQGGTTNCPQHDQGYFSGDYGGRNSGENRPLSERCPSYNRLGKCPGWIDYDSYE